MVNPKARVSVESSARVQATRAMFFPRILEVRIASTMKAPHPPWRRAVRPLVVVGVVGVLFLVAQSLRVELGLEWSTDSIQETVRQLGIWAPVGFVVLVVFRQFMALPSVLVLTSAGLLFGAPLGALLGGLGITLNALTLFTSARLFGGDWALPRLHARFPEFEERANAAGPLVIALMTGHPMGLLTPFHLAAGVTSMGWGMFALAVGPAALFRAGCYSFLGAHLLEPGTPRFWIATGVLIAAALLPLAHPGVRSRILRRPGAPKQ
jgi:uncharacterized membrane protein YdjX (TVP38/TMEM64 family)